MSTWIGRSIESPPHALGFWSRLRKPWVFLGMALALAYLPHLISYSGNLMQREHYQFFPLAWLGAIALVWIRRDTLRFHGEVTVPALGWVGVVLGSLLLGAAGILNSSWLAMVSVLPLASGMAWLVGGWSTVRVIGPALVLFATTLRLPGSLDAVLIRQLRALAVGISSRVLDLLGIIHVPLGNVLRVPGGDLLVDEACSGVNSLVSIVAVVLFLGLLLRRRPIHLAIVLAWSAGIVLLANVARVSIVTIAFTRWHIDLLRGWKHEALGVALYAVSLSLVASLDQFVLLLGTLSPRRSSRLKVERKSDGGDLSTQNQVHSPPSSERAVSSFQSPAVESSPCRFVGSRPRRMVIGATVLTVLALINPVRWACGVLLLDAGITEAAPLVKRAHEVLSEQSMPVELDGWRRVGFRTDERKRDDALGQYSACWQYRLGPHTAHVSVDYPFLGWHELTSCYEATGWTPQRRLVQRGSSDDGSGLSTLYLEVSLNNVKGEFASVTFGLVDYKDHWIEPPAENGLGLAGRERAWKAVPIRPAYQFQVFGTGFRPKSNEENQQFSRLFQAACREFKRQLFDSGEIVP